MTSTSKLLLAAEFAPAIEAQWRERIDAVLKGASFEKRLVRRTYDGLAIQPLYTRALQAAPIAGRAASAPWEVAQRIDHPYAITANTQALEDLGNGATVLTLTFAGSLGAHGFGMPATREAIAQALKDVFLDAVAVELDLPAASDEAVSAVVDLVRARGIKPEDTQLRIGLNPFVSWASTPPGNARQSDFAAKVRELREAGFKAPLAVADGRIVHNAGGSEAQELAFVLASAVSCLRMLGDGGMKLNAARDTLFFRLSADAQEFLTLAKFRALRKLWARVEEASGLTPKPIFISAETAWRMMTRRDPWVNILRTTVATTAAGLGGANAITVLPFTLALGLPDAFARRLARNTQAVLLEEAHLAKVSDPAAGSGAIEDMTAQLCRAAWALFHEIQAAGGLQTALASGSWQGKVADVREQREHAIAHRIDALTGTSEFPHLAELPVDVLAQASTVSASDAAPLAPIRLAAPFEQLRDASDRMLETTAKRPRIFLAMLGTPADYTARATFAKNFFEAGGIEAVVPHGLVETADDIASAFEKSKAALACICSSDAVYQEQAIAAARAFASVKPRAIYLAGKPGELEPDLQAAGVTRFIYAGCDVLATLQEAYDIIGASSATDKS